MKILHYFLGYPPNRSGGLVRYAVDLMELEAELGHSVYAFYPGNFRGIRIKSDIVFKGERNGVNVYEMTNALPVPLLYGIKSPSVFIKKRDFRNFAKFLKDSGIDVLHVHTLMGLPIEVLLIAKAQGIRLVFTTHDYYGLCLKVNNINRSGFYCETRNARKCMDCCAESPSSLFLKIRNSRLAFVIKKMMS